MVGKNLEEAKAGAAKQAQTLVDFAWLQVMEGDPQAPLIVPLR